LPQRLLDGFGYLEQEEHAMIHIGMDVHQKSIVFCFFDPTAENDRSDACKQGCGCTCLEAET
jgi:hypothetical protein